RSRHPQRDSSTVQGAEAARRETDSQDRRGLEAVPVRRVVVLVADAQKRAFIHSSRQPAAIASKVPRSLKSVADQGDDDSRRSSLVSRRSLLVARCSLLAARSSLVVSLGSHLGTVAMYER